VICKYKIFYPPRLLYSWLNALFHICIPILATLVVKWNCKYVRFITRASIPSLFLRFVLILQYYVLVNITVLISKKCPYLWPASLFFLIFCRGSWVPLSLVTLPNLGNCNVLLLSFAGCLLLVHCQANLIEKNSDFHDFSYRGSRQQ